ncbi:MAG: tol-pal system protein YbgF [Nitrospirae bacterium]|nr:tol-pal system protein YbgF [Nitrospirota bacterium]
MARRWIDRPGAFLIAGGLLVLAGCATTEDVAVVQRGQVQLTHEITQRVAKLESGQEEVRRNQADLGAKMDQISSEMQVLTGRFEESRHQSQRALQEFAALRQTQEQRLREMEQKIKSLHEPPASPTGGATAFPAPAQEAKETKEAKPPVKKSPEEIYKEAYDTLKEGHPAEAREQFKKFLKLHPKSDLADNAQYWIGETHYVERDYEKAVLAFEELVKKYPKGDKVPGALLKEAYAFLELKDKSNARTLLKRLVALYPKSEEAALAKKKLKELK